MFTFDDAWDELAPDTRPAILLGNGFSQAWDTEIFNYASLLEVANFEGRELQIRELFTRLNTWDFEAVMRTLLSAQTVAEVYALDQAVISRIRADQEILKNALLSAVSNSHPRLPSALTVEQYQAVRTFLRRFNHIFTVNYDLLMYWARNQEIEPAWQTDDGFRAEQRWRGYGTEQEVHFLHGGIHLYEEPTGIRKHAYTGEIGGGIVDQVRANLNMQPPRFPLFVSEPIYQKKKQRIDRSPYLTFCLRKLETSAAPLFILGHSMDQNDMHIFEAIRKSEARQIFVSIFGDEQSDANRKLRAHALTFLGRQGRNIEFFDASTANAWG